MDLLPGPTIEARADQPLLVEWPNELPSRHFLPIDHNLHGAEKACRKSRGVVHVHGARVPAGQRRLSRELVCSGEVRDRLLPERARGGGALVSRPRHGHHPAEYSMRDCSACTSVRDDAEDALNLPRGKYEIPSGHCGSNFHRRMASWSIPSPGRRTRPGLPEVFGNAMLVNGKLAPFLDVEPRPYRFRILNASNARFYRLVARRTDNPSP